MNARPYRILVTGSRHWGDRARLIDVLDGVAADLGPQVTITVVHGMCDPRNDVFPYPIRWLDAVGFPASRQCMLLGADWIADRHARERGWNVEMFPADWTRGRRAGPERNQRMVDAGAEVCLGFPMPDSRGSYDCLAKAAIALIPTVVYKTETT